MQLEFKARGNTEVTAAATDRPKQIGMGFVIYVKQLPIGSYNFSGK